MNIRNLPPEYAITFVIVAACIAAVTIIIGTKKLTSDLDRIDSSVEKTRMEMEKTSSPKSI